MKSSKYKELILLENKIYLYISSDDIYLRIDKVKRDSNGSKVKVHKIKKLTFMEPIRNFFRKIPIKKHQGKVIKFRKIDKNKRNVYKKKRKRK